MELRQLLDDATELIQSVDLEGSFVYVNRTWLETLGYADEDVARLRLDDVIHPASRKHFGRLWQRVLQGDPLDGVETTLRTADGASYPVSGRLRARFVAGKPEAVHGHFRRMAQDSTPPAARHAADQRVGAARATPQDRATLESILNAATQLSIIATDRSGVITVFNTGAERMLGYRAEEMIGKCTPAVIHLRSEMEQRSRELSAATGRKIEGFDVFVAFAREKSFERRDWTYVRKDGSQLIVRLVVTAVTDDAGEETGYLGIAEDITERKQAEETLRKTKEAAEAASRAKSEFLANMSHEIRTPMNGVIGMTDLALRTELSDEQREYLETVKQSADSLLTIINDILDFSKVEAGIVDLESVDFELRGTLADTLRSLAVRAEEKGLELMWRVAPEVPDALAGAGQRLRQIVTNLVGNAIKFTPQGEVLLNVELREVPGDSVELEFSVSDTGIGVPLEKQETIFEAFTQVNSPTTSGCGGTGLGLAISARLVSLMGGRIWIDSTPQVGTAIFFTSSFARQTKPHRSGRYAELAPLAGLPVLVVDDNATQRRILAEILTAWKLRPTAVDSEPAALAAAAAAARRGEAFAVALIDCHLGDSDGYFLVEKLSQLSQSRANAIMMLTSVACDTCTARCEPSGTVRYLLKPLKETEMVMAIAATHTQPPDPRDDRPQRPRPAKPQRAGYRVLVVEDNAVNQLLIKRLLEYRGYETTLVSDGRQAVQAAVEGGFDILLMDVQLPELDGLAATREIRKREKRTGGHVPVIAMTAFAMKGDRERCLAAGMDGYVAKPINPVALFTAIENYARGASPAVAKPISKAPLHQSFDHRKALAYVGGNQEILQELIELFLHEFPKLRSSLEDAISRRDPQRIHVSAHRLKCATGNFFAPALQKALTKLEILGRQNELDRLPTCSAQARSEFDRLEAALRDFLAAPREPSIPRAHFVRTAGRGGALRRPGHD